ncbi:NAD(P)H-binding protein [Pseudoalteromonas byunsanensis]|uniref:NAD-dependent epimerase n=1 Tax=Pseudoalteromonas byunsanensis TaxID=327939 RepID=A0A1S1NAU1_9GAMM|nr:NAD(P)-binding oxidoreductase [Pseudoalteromonas byunsanensis]OHU96515.1 NAD-dependent epimerase [Pseudoalteromonas byunsanensis]
MDKILVIGASGATGKLVVEQLLAKNIEVIAIVRPVSSLQNSYGHYKNYIEVKAEISQMSSAQLANHVVQCHTVISCLGHNLSFSGIYGVPRKLVADSIKKVTTAICSIDRRAKTKVILMNSTAVSNLNIQEYIPLSQRIVIAVLRLLLPPQSDNEQAADHLRVNIGKEHPCIQWVSVRPDSLVDEQEVSSYYVEHSPTSNVVFDAGRTSRINVANFMMRLTTEDALWHQWQGKMPVIYNG